MSKLYIPILLGTGREGRQSEKVARFALFEAAKFGFKTELVDVRDFANPVTIPPEQPNAKIEPWRKIIKRAHGLIIVTPEYNHSYPGELKIMLDALEDEYRRKPVALCTVSSGPIGGARLGELILPVLHSLHMVVVTPPVYFPKVKELFDEQGMITDGKYKEKLNKLFTNLAWYAGKLN